MQSSTQRRSRGSHPKMSHRKWLTLPKTHNSSHLKVDGRNTSFLLGLPIFRCNVSFREGTIVVRIVNPAQNYRCLNRLIIRTTPKIMKGYLLKINIFHQGYDRHVNGVKHLKPQFHGEKIIFCNVPCFFLGNFSNFSQWGQVCLAVL